MAKPLVAIVGRPNVGKSTLFNCFIGQRMAIVEDTPGVTRDRLYADAEWCGREFAVVDTGGIDPEDTGEIGTQMREQALLAVDTADVIVFLVDGDSGLSPVDEDVAQLIRCRGKDVVLVVNKVDSQKKSDNLYDFYALGLGEPYAVSAAQKLGLGDVLDRIVEQFPREREETLEADTIHIAVVGRPNVGKSSLVNKLLGQTRAIVNDAPGTTRDAIDTPFEKDGQHYVLIDTAGMRKRARIEHNSVERYAVVRALTAIRRADVVLLVIDSTLGAQEQDARIAGFIKDEGKACVVVFNKWDLVEKETNTAHYITQDFKDQFAFINYAQVLYISALTGQRVDKLLGLVHTVYKNTNFRIPTGVLNQVLVEAVAMKQPPTKGGQRLKIYYWTQTGVKPPTFVLFINDKKLMHFSYLRYLENQIRRAFSFEGTPLRFILRNKEKP